MFLINDIGPAEGYFDAKEITDGVSELSLGYAVTETFKVENKQGTKALCFGDDSFDGIQDVISPLAVNTYTPDAHGTYSIYDAPYYPNLLWEGSSFSHISPFARPLSGSELGTFEFNMQSIIQNNREYIKAEINLNEVLKNNEIVDIYLYNLTLSANVGDRELPVDNVELMEGEKLVLNNTGPDKILWYYGKLDPCDEDDIEGIIEEKLMSSCGGADGLEDCIKNPRGHSVSPIDMIDYLDTKGRYAKKLEINSGGSITIPTVSPDRGHPPHILYGPSGGETSVEYMFYNPYSGKSFIVRVYREVVDVKLQINSFSPSSISVAEGSQVCITNTDDVDRGLNVLVDSPETITLSPGGRKCLDANPTITRAIVDPLTGRKLERTISGYDDRDVLGTIQNIAREIAVPKSGANNPVYDYQLLNPRAPATPSVISTEVIDVDVLVKAVDEFDFEVFKGIAQQVAVIEETCRFEQAAKAQQCGSGAGQGPSNDNLEHKLDYVDFSMDGCCCRKIGEKEIDYSDCISLDEERCTGSYKYTYTCPYETSVYKQRCLSTIPIYIKIGADETEISPEKVKAMKMAIDLIHNELDNIEPFRSDRGETVDLLGFIILIEDPGPSKRGECKIASYLDGIKDVSKHAVVEHGTPSIILGFGLNRNPLEWSSCWTDTELGEQVRGLYQEEFMTMIGYGIIGMGQYCLIDTACQPLSVGGLPRNDYGLYYKQGETFTYHGDSAVLLGTPSFTDYLTFSLLGGGTSTLGTNWLVDAGITGYQEGFDPEQGVSLFSGYSGISRYHEGISALGAYGVGTPSSPFMSFAADLNDPSRVLSGLTRKDPYARAWFDQCGKYYYEGLGQVSVTFSESDIPPGQQGSQCDPSRMMELYKKYKCE